MNIKRLVLGTAAGALAVTGAQAADLPVVVEPVDYVRICDAAGTGHFYIPGTETCMNIRTRVRTDYNLYFDFDEWGDPNFYDGDVDDRLYRFRARGYVRTSTITQTEFGQLTTFVDIFVTKDSAARGGGGASDASVELDSALEVLSADDEGPDLVLYYKYILTLLGESDFELHFNEGDSLSDSQKHNAESELGRFQAWWESWPGPTSGPGPRTS